MPQLSSSTCLHSQMHCHLQVQFSYHNRCVVPFKRLAANTHTGWKRRFFQGRRRGWGRTVNTKARWRHWKLRTRRDQGRCSHPEARQWSLRLKNRNTRKTKSTSDGRTSKLYNNNVCCLQQLRQNSLAKCTKCTTNLFICN